MKMQALLCEACFKFLCIYGYSHLLEYKLPFIKMAVKYINIGNGEKIFLIEMCSS